MCCHSVFNSCRTKFKRALKISKMSDNNQISNKLKLTKLPNGQYIRRHEINYPGVEYLLNCKISAPNDSHVIRKVELNNNNKRKK